MTIQNLNYFYDAQIRRFLEQIVRAFSGWQYETGGTNPQRIMVPCRMALSNSVVASILTNNSDNTALTCPMITIALNHLEYDRESQQDRNLVDKRQVVEREIVDGVYTGKRGNGYTVERIMPTPFIMKIQIDIWTSNQSQKAQLLEQILSVICPSFDIQNSTNPLDWTALTTMYFEDMVWSSKSIPVGSAVNEIDVATINMKMPFWLSSPAKVKRQTLIQQIITNVFQGDETSNGIVEGAEMFQVVTTPGDYAINVSNGVIDFVEGRETWEQYIDKFGILNPTVSQLRLYQTPDFDENSTYIAGTIQLSNNPNQLLWQILPETLPANTLPAVTAVIDPLRTNPTNTLAEPVNGAAYLILQDISPSQAWGNITAYTNDIITYNGTNWTITFDASASTTIQYVLNSYSGTQLRFTNGQWEVSIDGMYNRGYWVLDLSPQS